MSLWDRFAGGLDRAISELERRRLVAGGLALLLIVGVSVSRYRSVRVLEAELDESALTLKKLSAIVAQVEEVERMSSAFKNRLSVCDALARRRYALPHLLERLHSAVPSGLELSQLSLRPQKGTSSSLSMTLSAPSDSELAGSLSALRAWKPMAREDGIQELVIVSSSAVSAARPSLAVEVLLR